MIKILFICHGNICRSPIAEFIMKKIVKDAGLEKEVSIASAATSSEEIGNDIYPKAKRKLLEKGIPFSRHYAKKMTAADYENFDIIVAMDGYNLSGIDRIVKDVDHKVIKLNERDVADPWYSDDFERAYREIYDGCMRLFEKIEAKI